MARHRMMSAPGVFRRSNRHLAAAIDIIRRRAGDPMLITMIIALQVSLMSSFDGFRHGAPRGNTPKAARKQLKCGRVSISIAANGSTLLGRLRNLARFTRCVGARYNASRKARSALTALNKIFAGRHRHLAQIYPGLARWSAVLISADEERRRKRERGS